MRQHAAGKFKRVCQVRAALFGLEEQHLANHAQDVAAAFARRDEFLDSVREQQQADLVVVADRREREHRGDLGGEFAFGLIARAEQARATDVHDEQEREFARWSGQPFCITVRGSTKEMTLKIGMMTSDVSAGTP